MLVTFFVEWRIIMENTGKITMDWLLRQSGFDGLECVCASEKLGNLIKGVHIMDNPDTFRFFKEGELAITTGYIFRNMTDEQMVEIINGMSKRGCCGVVFKINRFFDLVPDAILNEASRLSLPILSLPYKYAISEVQMCVLRKIFVLEMQNVETSMESEDGIFEIFNPQLNKSELGYICKTFGIDVTAMYCVLLFSDVNDSNFQKKISEICEEEGFNVHVGKRRGEVFALIKLQKSMTKVENTNEVLRIAGICLDSQDEKVNCGISGWKTYEEFSQAQDEARKSLLFNEAFVDSKIKPYKLWEMHIYIYENISRVELERLVKEMLQKIVDEMEDKNTDYLQTLNALVNNAWKTKETAEELFIHRNTLIFRKNKIFEVLGMEDTPENRFKLEFTIYAWQICKYIYGDCANAQ